VRNAHAERWLGRETELKKNIDEEAQRYKEARERGDFDVAGVIAGEAVGLIHDLPSAAEIVGRVVRQAESLLRER
jgi:nitronate monooxygenase